MHSNSMNQKIVVPSILNFHGNSVESRNHGLQRTASFDRCAAINQIGDMNENSRSSPPLPMTERNRLPSEKKLINLDREIIYNQANELKYNATPVGSYDENFSRQKISNLSEKNLNCHVVQ